MSAGSAGRKQRRVAGIDEPADAAEGFSVQGEHIYSITSSVTAIDKTDGRVLCSLSTTRRKMLRGLRKI